MPAPLAKGIVITVSVIVAAGIAVYESPQFQQWIDSSRRKIAVAIHNNFGDGARANQRSKDDISMTEELGPEAEQRREKVREEIRQRGAILKARSHRERGITTSTTTTTATSSPSASFDELVDKDGRLKKDEGREREQGQEEPASSARATAIDMQTAGLVHRHPDSDTHPSNPQPDLLSDLQSEQHRADTPEPIAQNQLRLDIPSAPPSTHPSESLVDLTPTSEFPDTDLEDAHQDSHNDDSEAERVPHAFLSQSGYMSVASSHTEDGEPDFYYAHPYSNQQVQNHLNAAPLQTHGNNPFADVSTASSVASSAEFVEREPLTPGSDGTLSDVGEYVRDMHTPISWSEVGSVVSSNDGGHQ